MKWEKLGKIFDPTDFHLSDGCTEFAKSPQVLMFDNFVRIYFCTCAVGKNNGKLLSYVSFVDMRKNFRDIIKVSEKTVLPLGKLGCFDEHGIFPINILQQNNAIYGYTCGWSRRVSVSVETAIGMVMSYDNGNTFQRSGDGPILAASLHEPCLVGDAFVKVFNDAFHMWYIFGTGWKKFTSDSPPDRTYKIGHAVSSDGVKWQKDEAQQIISDCLGEEESQALPTVLEISGRYHMLFCYRQSFDFRETSDRGYRIGHAWSNDLVSWTRDDTDMRIDVSPGEWDSDMLCYPHLFKCNGGIYLLYNGNEFGRYGFGLAVLGNE